MAKKKPTTKAEAPTEPEDVEQVVPERERQSTSKQSPTKKSTKRTRGGEDRAAANGSEQASSSDVKPSTSKKAKSVDTSDESTDEASNGNAQTYEKKGSWKIVSWNVNGIRAWLPKGGVKYIKEEAPDVFCVQETKCSLDKLPDDLKKIKGYKNYFLAGDKDGYSGVGVLSKREPIKVTYGIGHKKHDSEGRVVTLEFEDFYVVNAYVPNAGRGLVRLEYRMDWDKDFRSYLCNLKKKKGVILAGDLNVAHNEIDLKNPKSNKRNAGFTEEERGGMTSLLSEGFVDSFRKLYPDREGAYTFWTYMMNARAKNVGWRLDYFVVSENLVDRVIDNEIRDKVLGSDHCPIVLHLK